jgi:hypothetical protein
VREKGQKNCCRAPVTFTETWRSRHATESEARRDEKWAPCFIGWIPFLLRCSTACAGALSTPSFQSFLLSATSLADWKSPIGDQIRLILPDPRFDRYNFIFSVSASPPSPVAAQTSSAWSLSGAWAVICSLPMRQTSFPASYQCDGVSTVAKCLSTPQRGDHARRLRIPLRLHAGPHFTLLRGRPGM